jgi:MoaA/NifB/PqqE/SkfB family radical SAM enzyme
MLKALKGTPKHLSQTGELNSFTYLMLNLPFECNYRCPKCFNLEGNQPVAHSGEISLEERLALIQDAKSLGGKVVVIAGEGEPSLSREIRPLVTEVNAHGMIPIVYTNGSVLSPELIEFYKRNNTSLVFSIDSLVPEVYDKLTGTKGQLDRVVRNARNAIDSYRETIEIVKDLKLVRIAINATATSLNENGLSEMKRFWEDDIYFICNPLARSGNAVGNWNELIVSDDVYARQKQLVAELSESGGPLTLGRDGLCGYSIWGIAVSPCGDYMTCAYTMATDGLLGNVRTRSLRDAFEHKHRIESEHYKSKGAVPCIIRSSGFGSYLEELRKRV